MEREYKFLVERRVFDDMRTLVRQTVPGGTSRLQINHYYDDAQLSLRGQDITLRVRQIGQGLVLQWKRHVRRGLHYAESEEREQPLTKLPYAIGAYTRKGRLATVREEYPGRGYHIDFDTNTFLGVRDYEIEIEWEDDTPGPPPLEWITYLTERAQTSPGGKGTRFFTRWEALGGRLPASCENHIPIERRIP